MHKYIVEDVNQATASTLLLTLRRDEAGAPFAFQPGQYAAISYYRRGRPSAVRCFSIVSSPTEQDLLQFSMRTKGRYTSALTKLRPGDKVEVRGPYGGFVFDSHRDSRTVFLSGGIGITPFMSMIRYATAIGADNKIDLLYSCATQDDVPFYDELKKLEAINHNLKVTFVISNGSVDKLSGTRTARGRISPELIDHTVPPALVPGTTFFICGPPPFMKGMNDVLQKKGVQKNFIMTEAFSQGPNHQTGKVKNWPLNMYALSALGMVASYFAVIVVDMLKTLPPSQIFGTESIVNKAELTNSRQADLDAMVNLLPIQDNTAPNSAALTQALANAEVKIPAQQTAQAVQAKPKVSTTNPTSTAPVTAAPTPKQPTCTTNQSGVTTCI